MMQTIEKLYSEACSAYGREFNPDQGKTWKAVLGGYQASALQTALRTWQGDTSPNGWDGRAIGATFPTPADIRTIIERDHERQKAAKTSRFEPCERNGCEGGWVRVTKGKTAGGNPISEKVGALRRCACWWEHLCRVLDCSLSNLPAR